MTSHATSRFIAGPAGRLDSRWHGPPDGRPLLLLHPHPQFGGTMGSRLVYDLAVGLAADGWRVARFDFRGVGRSEGSYGDGVGEADDALAMLQALAEETGRRPVVVGYSFGGAVAVRAAARAGLKVERIVTVAMPADVLGSRLDPAGDAPGVCVPVHLIVGDQDLYVTVAQAEAVAARFKPPARLTVLPAAGHFLEPSSNHRVLAAVREALRD